MRIDTPDPAPRSEGDYEFYVGKGYGKPAAYIDLDVKGDLTLRDVNLEDCERLIKAAALAAKQIRAYLAEMTAPHGRTHLYKGTCQLCGKPEDDELHAEPATETVPWPTGLCGHTVTPGAWSQGFTRCRDCLVDWDRQEAQARYDRATAGEQLDGAAS